MNPQKEKEYLKKIEEKAASGPYLPDWDSLAQMQVPKWFGDAKFGIFIHWGLYSVPAHANEWYSRNMYIKGSEEWEYHRRTFGEHTKFGYKDFIPLFKAEKFCPQEWVKLFKEAGARYLFPVAEHHDGYQMYCSGLSEFNAYATGPHRDIIGELKAAAEQEGMHFCTSSHRAEHWFFMGNGKNFDSDIREPLKKGDFYWPAMPEPDFQDLQSSPRPNEEFLTDWLLRTCEIIDRYQPEILYFDWWIQHESFRMPLKTLAAYYYNTARENDRQAAICYKHDAMMFGCGIPEVERGSLASVRPYIWQTDTAIAKNSWCYTDSLEYKTSRQIICEFADIISKNGNMLLNVGPRADGSIAGEDKSILLEIGEWMHRNAEAIYGSRPWKVSAEGPHQAEEGQFTDSEEIAYSPEDIRFTASGGSIYAFILRYPEDGRVLIKSLADSEDANRLTFHGLLRGVSVLGFEETPVWTKDGEGLHVQTQTVSSEFPVVIKITMQ